VGHSGNQVRDNMAKYEITSPDGRRFEITAPDGVSPDAVMSYAKMQFGAKQPIKDNLNAETLNPTLGMSGVEKFAAGAGKAVADMGRGIGQLIPGLVSRQDVAESRGRDKALMNTGAGLAGDVTGSVLMTLLPGGALRAAGGALGAPALTAMGSSLLAPTTITGAAGVGAGMGLLQPSASTEETLANTALGGVAGAAIPTIVRGAKAVKSTLEPFYKEGQAKIMARLLQKSAGGDAQNVAQRITEATKPAVGPFLPGEAKTIMGELVPGSAPTLGQIAGNPGVGALERTLSATNPEVGRAIGDKVASQNAARVASLENIAGVDGTRMMFDEARNATAETLYQKAFNKKIPEKVAAKLQPQLESLLENPAIQDAIPVAKRLAKFDKIDITDPAGSIQGLHYIKKALDDLLDKAKQTGIGKIEYGKIANTKDELLGLMDKMSPAYATARAEFQAASKPINQMDVAQELLSKSVRPLDGTMQASAYARALNDSTAAKATGLKSATLESTMSPHQLVQLEALKADLARATAANNVGRGVGSDTIQKMAYSNMIDSAGVPSWIRGLTGSQIVGNIAGRGADAIYGRANREMATRLAEMTTDPQAIAGLLSRVQTDPLLFQILSRTGAGAGATVPGLMNQSK
jgi:hypothetical protein